MAKSTSYVNIVPSFKFSAVFKNETYRCLLQKFEFKTAFNLQIGALC